MTLRSRFVALLGTAAVLAGVAAAVGGPSAHAAPGYGVNKWALIIGIDNYKKPTHPTYGGVGDARTMRALLLDNGWPADHIMVLQEGDATQANVRAGFQWLIDHSDDNSFSVFLYSGHVKQTSGDRDRDGEKVDEWMWPWDNKLISDRELTNWLLQVRGNLWVDLAGCEAAGLDDGLAAPNRVVTAASQENEKGFERPDWHESVFNGTFLDQAMRQHMADFDGNGMVSIQEAFAFASREAPRMTAKQRPGPQHPWGAGGDGSEWFLNPPPPPPPPPPPSPPPPAGPVTLKLRVAAVPTLPVASIARAANS